MFVWIGHLQAAHRVSRAQRLCRWYVRNAEIVALFP